MDKSGCDGTCVSAADIGVGVSGIAIGHPCCPLHGDNVDALAWELSEAGYSLRGELGCDGFSMALDEGYFEVIQHTQSKTVNEASNFTLTVYKDSLQSRPYHKFSGDYTDVTRFIFDVYGRD